MRRPPSCPRRAAHRVVSSDWGSLVDRERELECGSRALFSSFDPNPATVPFENALRDGKPDARTFVLFARVKPLEDLEDALPVALGNANPIVGDGDHPFRIDSLRRYAHL